MKLRRLPEDFLVEELTDFDTGSGPFAFYQLSKRSLGTPEAIDAILRKWKLARDQVSYGGLKDRHAITAQFFTIRGGPPRGFKQTNLEVTYLGQASRPFGPLDIAGNSFKIVLRSLGEETTQRTAEVLAEVRRDGLPNYFDDQRFGSVTVGGDFVAKPWCKGDYERAVWLALAEPNDHDRPDDRQQKKILREHWGKWSEAKAALARSHIRSIVTYLDDRKGDFKGAISRIRVDLRGLYVSAYQSFLWNRMLAALLRQECRPEQLCEMPLAGKSVPAFHTLDDAQRAKLHEVKMPLPSARVRHELGPFQNFVDEALSDQGLEVRELRVKYPRDTFFSKGYRSAVVQVPEMEWEISPDELYRGRKKLALSFELPRGCYATILVKRVMLKEIETDPENTAESHETAEHESLDSESFSADANLENDASEG